MADRFDRIMKKREERESSLSSNAQDRYDRILSKRGRKGFEDAYNSAIEALNSVNEGWQDTEAMSNYRKELDLANKTMTSYVNRFTPDSDISNAYNNFSEAYKNFGTTEKIYGKYKNADAFNKAMEKAKQTPEKKKSAMDKYKFLAKNADFAEKSLYQQGLKSNSQNALGFLDDSVNQSMYKYLNTGEWDNNLIAKGAGMDLIKRTALREQMTEDELAKYNYLYSSDANEAFTYLNELYNDRIAQEFYDKNSQELREWQENHGVVPNLLLSAGADIAGSAALLQGGGSEIVRSIIDPTYNPYAGVSGLYNMTSEVNANIGDIAGSLADDNPVGKYLLEMGAGAVTSGTESRIRQTLFGSAANVVMGMGSYLNTYKNAMERGLPQGQAVLTAGIAGLTEWLTEEVGMERALRGTATNVIAKLAKQGTAEGLEELVGNVVTSTFDQLINRNQSEYVSMYNDLLERGYSQSEARHEVELKIARDWSLESLSAFFSTAPMGTAQAISTAREGSNVDSNVLRSYLQANPESDELGLLEKYGEEFGNLSNWQKGEALNIADQKLSERKITDQAGLDKAFADRAMLNSAYQSKDRKSLKKNYNLGKESTDSDGNKISVDNVSTEDGKTVIESNGQKYNADEVTLSENDAYIVNQASKIKNETLRNLYVQNYNGQDIASYDANFELASEYGSMGLDKERLMNTINTKVMPLSVANDIYDAARVEDAEKAIAARKANTDLIAKWNGTYKKGNLDLSSLDVKNLTKDEKRVVDFLKVFSTLGMNIRVIKDSSTNISGNYDTKTGDMLINLAGKAYIQSSSHEGRYAVKTFFHESTHMIKHILGEEFDLFQSKVREYLGADWADRVAKRMEAHKISEEEAEEEVVARFCEDFYINSDEAEKFFSSMDENAFTRLFNHIKAWFKKVLDGLNEWVKSVPSESVEAQMAREIKKDFEAFRKEWVGMFERALAKRQATIEEVVNQTIEGIKNNDQKAIESLVGNPETTKNSIAMDSDLANDTLAYQEKHGVLKGKDVIALTESISYRKGTMLPVLIRNKRKLPADIAGDIFSKNLSYGRSAAHSLQCVRSLNNLIFTDHVANEVGRPLTVAEQIAASELLAGVVGDQRECQYCYNAADRKAYEAGFGMYLDSVDEIRKAVKKNKKAYKQEYKYIKDNYEKFKANATPANRDKFVKNEGNTFPLFAEFLNKRAMSPQMIDRFLRFVGDALEGKEPLNPKAFANEENRTNAMSDPYLAWYIKDATAWSRSSFQPKARTRTIKVNGQEMDLEYIAYNGNILDWDVDTIKALNSAFGLRDYSYDDFVPAFVLEDMQMVTDASVKGLKMLSYNKDVDFARAFAPTGMNINLSVYGVIPLHIREQYKNDKTLNKARQEYKKNPSDETRKAYLDALNKYIIKDEMQGANVDEVKALRKEYDNVGAVFVATNDDMVEWALAQDWIDIVIPYHIVRSAYTMKYFQYTNYKGQQEDRPQKDWADAKKKNPNLLGAIPPALHNNDRETYERLLKENHLTHRFPQWANNPNYMKLVNETRRSYGDTEPVKPIFDYEALDKILDRIEEGGVYGEYVESNYEETLQNAVKLINAGKTSQQDVEDFYAGKLKLSEQISDEEYSRLAHENPEQARQILDKVAKANGAISLRNWGDPTHFFHGTKRKNFNVFDTESTHGGWSGYGFYFTPDKNFAAEYAMRETEIFETYLFPTALAKRGDKRITAEEIHNFFADVNISETSDEAYAAQISNGHTNFADTVRGVQGGRYVKNTVEDFLQYHDDREVLIGLQAMLVYKGYSKISANNTLKNKFGYWGVSDARETVVWFPNDIKSADLITYDDNGKEIPLSQRFEPQVSNVYFSEQISEDTYEKMKEHFGTTENMNVAGYMLKDGTLLDFSGKHWGDTTSNTRTVDHRDIQEVLPDDDNGFMSVNQMRVNGNIRLEPEIGGINLAIEPTKTQYDYLQDYVSYMLYKRDSEGVVIDFDDEYGNTIKTLRYEPKSNPKQVLNDIRNYFQGREESDLMKFHTMYSEQIAEEGYIETASRKLGLTNERIDKLLSGGYYGSTNPNYAQAYITYMSPDTFIKLTAGKNPERIERLKDWSTGFGQDGTPFDFEKMKEGYNRVPMQIVIDESTNEVYNHEGRHRMLQLKAMGYEQVPVLVFNHFNKYDKHFIESIDLYPQQFDEYDHYDEMVTLHNLLPFSQSNADRIKAEYGEGNNAGLHFSEAVDSETYKLLNENENLKKRNTILEEDIKRLEKLVQMQGKVTKGLVIDRKKVEKIAGAILKERESKYDKRDLTNALEKAYQDFNDVLMDKGKITSRPRIGDADVRESLFEGAFRQFYDIADKVLSESNTRAIDVTYKTIANEIRNAKVKFTEAEIEQAKAEFGNSWSGHFISRITLSEDGESLNSLWNKWAEKYPHVFNKDEKNKVVALIDTYKYVKDAQNILQTFNEQENLGALTEDIYNRFWGTTLETVADKYEAQIKDIKAKHKEAMHDLREQRDEAIKRVRDHKNEVIKKVRAEGQKRLKDLKQHYKDMNARKKEEALRRSTIKKIMATATDFMNLLHKNSLKEPIIEPLKPLVEDFLRAIDFSSKQALGMQEGKRSRTPTKQDTAFLNALNNLGNFATGTNLTEELMNLREYLDLGGDSTGVDDYFGDRWKALVSHVVELSSKRQAENTFVLQQMTSEELTELNDLLKELKVVIKEANNLVGGANNIKISKISNKDIDRLNSIGKAKASSPAMKKFKGFLNWSNTLPVYAFKHIGEGATIIFREMMDGMDKLGFLNKQIMDFANDTFVNDRDEDETDIHEETLTVTDKNGNSKEVTFKISDAQLMTLHCLRKRAHALPHIHDGGIQLTKINEKGKEVEQSQKIPLSDEQMDMLESKYLSKEQIDRADKMQKFLSDFSKKNINEVTLKMRGVEIANEDYYFPIDIVPQGKTDKALAEKIREQGIYKLLNSSFTKPLVDRASNPIAVGNIYDVFIRNTSESAKYNAYALPMRDMIKYINYRNYEGGGETVSIYESLTNAFGQDAYNYVIDFLKDLGGLQDAGRGDTYANTFVRGYKVAQVAANLQVAILQPVAITRASLVLPRRYILKAMAMPWKIPKGIKKMHENSGVSLIKEASTFDINLSRGMNRELRKKGIKETIVDWSTKLASVMDTVTWATMWNACEAEYKDKNGAIDKNAYKDEINKRFRDIVFFTQVTDSVMTRSSLMRSQSQWAQMATAFASEPTVSYNVLQDSVFEYAQDVKRFGKAEAFKRNGKRVAKAVEIFLVNAAVESILRTLMSKYRKPDEEEDTLESLWKEFLEQANPLNTLPLFRDIYTLWQGYDVNRMDTESIANAINAFKKWGKIIKGDKDVDYKTIYNTIQSISQLTGVPAGSLMREVISLWNLVIGNNNEDLMVK